MGLEFLARVQRTSLVVGLLAALSAVAYGSNTTGIALAAGLVWSLVNLSLLRSLTGGLVAARLGRPGAMRRFALGGGGTALLFAAGAWLLVSLPQLPLAAGFSIPFAVMVLKAASRMILASPRWTSVTRSAWTGLAVLGLVIAIAWLGAEVLRPMVSPDAAAAGSPHAAPAATDAHATDSHDADAHGDSLHAAGHGSDHGESSSSKPKMFPNLIGLIADANHDQPWAHTLHHFEYVLFAIIVALLLGIVTIAATRSLQMVPAPLQNAVESFVEAAYQFIVGILGPKYGPRFVPFLGTMFLYIWAMNFFGVIPFMHSPTASLNITVAMALTVFVFVQYTALRENGLGGWLFHMAGSPRTPIGWALVPLMLPVELIGELAKPISLSCRLFGNIFGEDMLIVGFATLGVTALAATGLPFGLPLQLPFLFLGVLITQPVQALVFTMLSTVYFLLMLPHDHGHGHGEEAHHAH